VAERNACRHEVIGEGKLVIQEMKEDA